MKQRKGNAWWLLGVCLLVLLLLCPPNPQEPLVQEEKPSSPNPFPTGCLPHLPLPAIELVDAQGERVNSTSWQGKVAVLLFGAQNLPEQWQLLWEQAQAEQTTQFFWVQQSTNNQHVAGSVPVLQDIGSAATRQLGFAQLPAMVVVDADGIVRSVRQGELPTATQLAAMVQAAKAGAAAQTLAFVEQRLLLPDGTVAANWPQQTPLVLSESSGLLLEYAVQTGNQQLFQRLSSAIGQQLAQQPLLAWKSKKGRAETTNAAVDDLRVAKALLAAPAEWEVPSELAKQHANSLYKYNTRKGQLVDFYDFGRRAKARQLTLCYANFSALELLKKQDIRWQAVERSAISVVEEGYLGDEFPLYYPYYNYSHRGYGGLQLHMAEAMLTLWHLAQVQRLPPATLQWLAGAVEGDGIFARYDTNGKVVAGYAYESTAVYGLAALTAKAAGDHRTAALALGRMEQLRVWDATSGWNGSFSQEQDANAFDQCVALLAYAAVYNAPTSIKGVVSK